MFVLNPVFLALLAILTGLSGVPRCVQGQWWLITDEKVEYDNSDEQSRALEDGTWADGAQEVADKVLVKDQNMLTTPEPNATKEQDDDVDGDDYSAVWEIILVVVILLAFALGSLSLAYYLCVWRGGRFFYQPHKQAYTYVQNKVNSV